MNSASVFPKEALKIKTLIDHPVLWWSVVCLLNVGCESTAPDPATTREILDLSSIDEEVDREGINREAGGTSSIGGADDTGDIDEPDSSLSPLSSGHWVNPFDWEYVHPQQDPFLLDQVDLPECAIDAHGSELISPGVWTYSVETDRCSWFTVRQPTSFKAVAGDLLRARVWHFELRAQAPAMAHIGLALSDEILLTTEEPIPQLGRVVTLEGLIDHDIPAQEELYFHIDNHGANSWHLLEVQINPDDQE